MVLTFNPYHLRVIAASRKKTDKRDAYWLAKTVQSGITPHPVIEQVQRLQTVPPSARKSR